MSNSQLSHLTEARLLWIYVCEMLSCLLSFVYVYCLKSEIKSYEKYQK